MKLFRGAGLLIVCYALLPSCGTPRVTNAPPEVVEACELEIALLTERDSASARDDTLRRAGAEPGRDTIDEARIGRTEAEAGGLADWPDDVLMYRCLAGRGIELTAEQTRVLAEWQQKSRRNKEP